MKLSISKIKLTIMAVLAPFIYGCGGGGGGLAGLTSFLFGSGSGLSFLSGGGSVSPTGISSIGLTSAEIATIHQPEPTSLLLLGSGVVAMAAYYRLTNKRG